MQFLNQTRHFLNPTFNAAIGMPKTPFLKTAFSNTRSIIIVSLALSILAGIALALCIWSSNQHPPAKPVPIKFNPNKPNLSRVTRTPYQQPSESSPANFNQEPDPKPFQNYYQNPSQKRKLDLNQTPVKKPSQQNTFQEPSSFPPSPQFDSSAPMVSSKPISHQPLSVIQHFQSQVIIPRLDLKNECGGMGATLFPPWGFIPLKLNDVGVIFKTGSPCPDNSVPGEFTKDPELMIFQQRHYIKFPLHLSNEHKVTLNESEKKAAGIPTNAIAFQFIYPGALNIRFDYPQNDTKENREALIDSIKRELRLEMQKLLLVGGYIYYSSDVKPDMTRDIAGINVLSPEIDQSANGSRLYFGQPKVVSKSIVEGLASLAAITDSYFNPSFQTYHNPSLHSYPVQAYPAMNPITVGPLLEKGLTHFKWLEPGHAWIKQMCSDLEDQTFGMNGVFIYYAKKNPALSCMLPITGPEGWTKLLRNTIYFNIEQGDEGVSFQAFQEEECVVCLESLTDEIVKVLRLKPCNHMNICEPCYSSKLKQIQCRVLCPTCRTEVTEVDSPDIQNLAYKPFTELGNLKLNLCEIELPYLLKSPLGPLLNNEIFKSPTETIPLALRKQLNLDQNLDLTTCSFFYPIYGKGMDATCTYLDAINKAVSEDSPNTALLRGLVSCGGFIFYDSLGQLKSVYAILPPNSEIKDTTHITLKTNKLSDNTISPEINKLRDTQEAVYNVSRITLANLLPFAKYFQYVKGHFRYSNGNPDQNWEATLT